MDLIIAGIFDPRCQFGHQALLRIKNIANTGGKGICESPLLEDIEVWPKLNVIDRILAMHLCEVYSSIIDSQTEYIPLAADLECEIRLFAKSSGIVRQAWGDRNICLRQTGEGHLAEQNK